MRGQYFAVAYNPMKNLEKDLTRKKDSIHRDIYIYGHAVHIQHNGGLGHKYNPNFIADNFTLAL